MPMFKKGKKDSAKDKNAEQSPAPVAEAEAQHTEEPEAAAEDLTTGEATEGAEAATSDGDAAGDSPNVEANKTSDLGDDVDADILDLFTDDDVIDEQLSNITSGLDDVDINDLLAQVRDMANMIGRRAA